MSILAQIVELLVQLAPEEQALIMAIIQAIKDAKTGQQTADAANAAAQQAMGLLMGRLGNIDAEAAGTNAAVDAEAAKKFGG